MTRASQPGTPPADGMRWLARGEQGMPAPLHWLAPAESARLAGLRFTKRRTEYLLRRWTAKHAVAVATGLPVALDVLARIEVRNAVTGAPIVLLDGVPAGLEVSLSDRAGWAACLVGPGRADGGTPVGCDLELVEPRSAGFVRDFLTPAEQRYVAGQPDGDARHAAANLIWSAKESALKVLRTGLRRDTRTVEVSTEPGGAGWTPLTVRAVEGRTFPGWWRRDGRFLFTVAAAVPTRPPEPLEPANPLVTAVPQHSWVDRPRSD